MFTTTDNVAVHVTYS